MMNSRTESSFWLRASAVFLVAMIAVAGALVADDQTAVTFKKRISHQVELDYLLHLPQGYDRSAKDQSWPLILFLHGAGERGSDLEVVKKHGPPKLIAAGKDIPAIVVSPQCPTDQWWNDHVEALLALLDDVAKKHRVDPDRVYVTGLSMGGFGTWALLARDGERFAAAIPICGGGSRLGLQRAMNVPIWAFHGDADPVVPVDETTRLVEAMKSARRAEREAHDLPRRQARLVDPDLRRSRGVGVAVRAEAPGAWAGGTAVRHARDHDALSGARSARAVAHSERRAFTMPSRAGDSMAAAVASILDRSSSR